ncbi:MAG: S1C family serine protease [Thermoguttaceae bacterium]
MLSSIDDPLWSALASEPTGPLGPSRRRKQDRTLIYVLGGGAAAAAMAVVLTALLILAFSGGRDVARDPGEKDTAGVPGTSDGGASGETPFEDSQSGLSTSPDPTEGFLSPLAEDRKPESPSPEASEPAVTDPPTSDPSPAEPVADAVRPVVASRMSAAESVDLLGLIDPARDAIGPPWTRRGSSLFCEGGARWALVVPKQPPAGYRWTVVLEPEPGDSANLCLVVDGRQVMLVLNGYGRQLNGLNRVNGRNADANETTRMCQVFHESRPTTIVCNVTRSSVVVTCDGRPLTHWRGSSQCLSVDRRLWQDLPADRLAITSYRGGPVRIDKLEIVETDPGEAMPYFGQDSIAEGGGPFGPGVGRTPWDGGNEASPQPSGPETSPPGPSQTAGQAAGETASPATAAVVPVSELPEAVRRSKESVCIIEHPIGSGTGFVVGKDLIATNAHVVDGAYVEEIECQFSTTGAKKYPASRILYEDAVRDLCLLEVRTDQAPIPIVADHQFSPNEKVMIIGNPSLGETDIVLRDAVTHGTLRTMVHTGNCDFYQIDGAVNPGSSGGPAINYEGAVVAVIAMKATERGETEIRQALRKLDDSFAGSVGSVGQKGIAFGIPVADLDRAIAQVQQQSESDVARVGDRHLAGVLAQRLPFVGGVNLVKLQLNMPAGVRQQAETLEMQVQLRRISPSTLNRIIRIDLMPAKLATVLRHAFEDEEFLKMLRACETGMEAKVKHLSASQHLDPAITSTFEALLKTVLQAKRQAGDPPAMYNAYAKVVKQLTEEMKEHAGRLSEQLATAKAAYEG